MRHDVELAYLGLEVPEPEGLTGFFSEVIGLVPGEDARPAPRSGQRRGLYGS